MLGAAGDLVNLVYWLAGIGCGVIVAVVVAVVVRRHRPDVWGALATWAFAAVGASIVRALLYLVWIPRAVRADERSVMTTLAIANVIDLLMLLALTALLVRGLVKLAQPPKPVLIENQPPYR
jgi:hypothetical protein